MKLTNVKIVTVVCEPILRTSIVKLSQNLGATGCTIWEIIGRGDGENESEQIPGAKIKMEIILNKEVAHDFLQQIAENYFNNYSIIVYMSDIQVVRPTKFSAPTTTLE